MTSITPFEQANLPQPGFEFGQPMPRVETPAVPPARATSQDLLVGAIKLGPPGPPSKASGQ